MGNTGAASPAAGSVWGVSSAFSLPVTDGGTLQTTILPMQLLQQTNAIVGVNTATTTTTTNTSNTNPKANSTASIILAPLTCPTGCNASAITTKFTGLPASSWITVEC